MAFRFCRRPFIVTAIFLASCYPVSVLAAPLTRLIEPLLPLSQPAQNYFVESILNGVYSYASYDNYKEYRADGLLTVGTSRFVDRPVFCVVGVDDRPDIKASVETLLAHAVETLTAGMFQAVFLDSSCWDATFPGDPQLACDEVPPGQITVFLWGGGYHSGLACQGMDPLPPAGGAITGGRLVGERPASENLGSDTMTTLRHELGHVFGLHHTWGDVNVMLYRSGRTSDFAPLEREAFAALYELPPGTGLHDLIDTGVIHDEPAVLNEPPDVGATSLSYNDSEKDHGRVWEDIYLWGQRLTLAFMTEGITSIRPINYAPPVVTFGDVSVVADLRDAYQDDPTSWFGAPAAVLKVAIPPGAGTPIQVSVRGQTTTFDGFSLDGVSVPYPSLIPAPVFGLRCENFGEARLIAWQLPDFFPDGHTELNSGDVLRRIYRNGIMIAELWDGLDFYDDGVYPAYEAHLYQVVLVNRTGAVAGIPSTVCALPSELGTNLFTPTPSRAAVPSTPTPTATATNTVGGPTPTEPLPSVTPTEGGTTETCTGDCGDDGSITVDDLVVMVNIALGSADLELCAAGDADDDGSIAVNEITLAVNNALNGCVPLVTQEPL